MADTPVSFGYLRVKAGTADNTIPLKDALVYVYSSAKDERRLMYSLTTDEDGLTDTVQLEAPPLSDSFSPDGELPFYSYSVLVRCAGYYPVNDGDVPVFPGITSLQNVNLIPLPEGAGKGGDRNG